MQHQPSYGVGRAPAVVQQLAFALVACGTHVLLEGREQVEEGFQRQRVPLYGFSQRLEYRQAGVTLVQAQGLAGNGMQRGAIARQRSEEHTSELQSLMRSSYA